MVALQAGAHPSRPHGQGAAPRLPAGGYRLSGRGLATIHLRVLRSAGPAAAPLLDRAAVRAPMVAYCDGPDGDGPHRADSAALPPDPRKRINDIVNQTNRATFFNAAWIPVRDAPGMRPAPYQSPKTCGEFRRAARDGDVFLHTKQFFQLIASPKAYDNLWRVWGLKSKPADFDQEVRGATASQRHRSATRTRCPARTPTRPAAAPAGSRSASSWDRTRARAST